MADKQNNWQEGRVFELMDGAVSMWVEQETIHLKSVERPSGDPVELTPKMAQRLAVVLQEMVDELSD